MAHSDDGPVLTGTTRSDDAFDGMLRASLDVSERPPADVQAALLTAVRVRAREREACAGASASETSYRSKLEGPVPWWVISLAGVLQSVTAFLLVGPLCPGRLTLFALGVVGALFSICAVVLPLIACGAVRTHGRFRRKEVCS